MTELAKEINIGLDSIVFHRRQNPRSGTAETVAPQIMVVDMPSSPFLYRQTLENLNDFNFLTLTGEDKKRGEM